MCEVQVLPFWGIVLSFGNTGHSKGMLNNNPKKIWQQ